MLPLTKDPFEMNENELATAAINIGLHIHRKWGPGLLESAYEELMILHLNNSGCDTEQQKEIPFEEDGIKLPVAFRTDIIIEQKLILELKSVEKLMPVHYKILLTYLRITDLRLGLLMNFGDALFKDGIKRVVNGPL